MPSSAARPPTAACSIGAARPGKPSNLEATVFGPNPAPSNWGHQRLAGRIGAKELVEMAECRDRPEILRAREIVGRRRYGCRAHTKTVQKAERISEIVRTVDEKPAEQVAAMRLRRTTRDALGRLSRHSVPTTQMRCGAVPVVRRRYAAPRMKSANAA
ncbi:MAG: hypothetical protein R3E53_03990 [Myxococcota bacterium]